MTTNKYYNPHKLFVGAFVPNWLLKRKEISAGAKLCFARLMQYAGEKGVAYPRQSVLAEELGIKERQLRNYLSELQKYELITVEIQGLGKPNLYKFCHNEWLPLPGRPATYCRSDRQDIAAPIHIYEENHIKESYKDMTGNAGVANATSVVKRDDSLSKKINDAFSYWQLIMKHPKAKLDKKRKNAIANAYKLGYTDEEIGKAVRGCSKSSWHMGKNATGTTYDDITLILRDSPHIEMFMDFDDASEEVMKKLKEVDYDDPAWALKY